MFPHHPNKNQGCASLTVGKESKKKRSPLEDEVEIERWGASNSCGGGTKGGVPKQGRRQEVLKGWVYARREVVLSALKDKDDPAHNPFVLRGG